MNTPKGPHDRRLVVFKPLFVAALASFLTLDNADHAFAQAPTARPQSESGASLKSRVQAFKDSAESIHQRVYRLFEPVGGSVAENQIPSILRQIAQNRERWAWEIHNFTQSGERVSLAEKIAKMKASISSEGGDEDDVKLAASLEEYLKSIDTSQKQLETDRLLLENEAKVILATAAVLSERIGLLTGQEDANAMVLRFVRDRVARGGFATGLERRPAAESKAAASPVVTPPKHAPSESPQATIIQGRSKKALSEEPQKKEAPQQAVSPTSPQAPPSIESVALSFFAAIRNRDLEWITGALDDPIRYYTHGVIPVSRAIADIQSDWRRYSNWRGTITEFKSSEPFSCTFTLDYSLIEGDKIRAANLKLGLTLNPKWPHRITKIYSISATDDPSRVPSPVASRKQTAPVQPAPSLLRREYRVNVMTRNPQVLLKKKPDINSETVVVVPKTTSGIVAIGEPTGREKEWLPVRIGNLSGFYILTEDLCLMGAPQFAVITPGSVESSWNEAVLKYPNLGVQGSSERENFSMRVQTARFNTPELLGETRWPLFLANQIFSAGHETPSAPTPTATSKWTADPALRALEQAMDSTYQKLIVQFGASPMAGRLRDEQAEWFDKRNALVSSQPKELQSAVAVRMTSERAERLDGLHKVAKRPGEPWKTYAAGAAPRGNILSVDQAAVLRDFREVGTPAYLVGIFIVTALDRNRAVLRAWKGQNTEALRVVVEFPPGQPLPGRGAIFIRNPDRGFLIREFRREADGTKVILATEVVRT
jgi:hypothetical protein